jgi:hypothetical protein
MHGDVFKSVYCHWDGYLDHNGRILHEHYDNARANNLVALGDISSLKETIGEKHPFSQFEVDMSADEYESKYGNMTTFYGRDREEKNTEWQVAHSFEEFLTQCDNSGAEYYYIMENGTWYCGSMYGEFKHQLVALSQALETVKETA